MDEFADVFNQPNLNTPEGLDPSHPFFIPPPVAPPPAKSARARVLDAWAGANADVAPAPIRNTTAPSRTCGKGDVARTPSRNPGKCDVAKPKSTAPKHARRAVASRRRPVRRIAPSTEPVPNISPIYAGTLTTEAVEIFKSLIRDNIQLPDKPPEGESAARSILRLELYRSALTNTFSRSFRHILFLATESESDSFRSVNPFKHSSIMQEFIMRALDRIGLEITLPTV